jgi:translation initiation factor 2B subunit (eIF-2B alpha/beta/delta family)
MAKAARTLEGIVSLINDSKVSQSVRNMLRGLNLLLQSRPNITSINHFLNHFLLKIDPEDQPIVLKELLEVFHERWKNVERKTAAVAISDFDFNNKTVLLHGNNKNIHILIETLAVNQCKIKIIQTSGRPLERGKLQAEELQRHGFEIRLIEDLAVPSFIPEADILLLGCDVIMHESFTGEFGSLALAQLANYASKPVYVLSDSRHILNTKFFSKSVTDTIAGTGKNAPSGWKDAPQGIDVISPSELETVPHSLVTKFVLENGAFSSAEIGEKIDKVLVFKFF